MTAVGRPIWPWVRAGAGTAILLAVVAWLGASPFLVGLRSITPGAVLAAFVLTAAATVVTAWRWSIVCRALGVGLDVTSGTAAYYRSQFLNSTLPGGVLGDVHRAVRLGRRTGDLGRGVRSVAWDRVVGQVVQIVAVLLALLALTSPLGRSGTGRIAVVAVGVLSLAGFLLSRGRSRSRSRIWGASVEVLARDLRALVLHAPTAARLVIGSLVVTAGHLCMFLVALDATGTSLPPRRAVPLGLVVLLAASIPANVAGWGPREGVAAWIFASEGLGAADGVAVTSLYAVLVLVSTLPGAVLLLQPGGSSLRGTTRVRAAASVPSGGDAP